MTLLTLNVLNYFHPRLYVKVKLKLQWNLAWLDLHADFNETKRHEYTNTMHKALRYIKLMTIYHENELNEFFAITKLNHNSP